MAIVNTIKVGDKCKITADWDKALYGKRVSIMEIRRHGNQEYARVYYLRDHILNAERFGDLFSVKDELEKI